MAAAVPAAKPAMAPMMNRIVLASSAVPDLSVITSDAGHQSIDAAWRGLAATTGYAPSPRIAALKVDAVTAKYSMSYTSGC